MFSMLEFNNIYERVAASTLRDVIAVSPKTFKKSGFDNDIYTVFRRNLLRRSVI